MQGNEIRDLRQLFRHTVGSNVLCCSCDPIDEHSSTWMEAFLPNLPEILHRKSALRFHPSTNPCMRRVKEQRNASEHWGFASSWAGLIVMGPGDDTQEARFMPSEESIDQARQRTRGRGQSTNHTRGGRGETNQTIGNSVIETLDENWEGAKAYLPTFRAATSNQSGHVQRTRSVRLTPQPEATLHCLRLLFCPSQRRL